jgi:hypothetical protein
MDERHSEKQVTRRGTGSGWQFAMFRAWREREHPRAAYLIAPRVWRPECRIQGDDASDSAPRALKNWEPRITGLAYSVHAVYLVEVVAKLSPSTSAGYSISPTCFEATMTMQRIVARACTW